MPLPVIDRQYEDADERRSGVLGGGAVIYMRVSIRHKHNLDMTVGAWASSARSGIQDFQSMPVDLLDITVTNSRCRRLLTA